MPPACGPRRDGQSGAGREVAWWGGRSRARHHTKKTPPRACPRGAPHRPGCHLDPRGLRRPRRRSRCGILGRGRGPIPLSPRGGGGTPPRRPRHPQHAQPALLYTPVAEGCVRACPGGGPAAARRTRRPLGQALSSLSLPSDTFSSSTAPCPLPPSRWLLGFASAFPNLAPHSSTLSAPPPPSPSPLLA